MNQKKLTKAIRYSTTLTDALKCEDFKGEIVLRINDKNEIHKINYRFLSKPTSKKQKLTELIQEVVQEYQESGQITIHKEPNSGTVQTIEVLLPE